MTAGLVAVLYLASAVGGAMDGPRPASGWVAIGAAMLVGAVAGGAAIGVQRQQGMARIAAPFIAFVLMVAFGVLAGFAVSPFDVNGSIRLGIGVATPFAATAVTVGTAIVAFVRPSRWIPVGASAATVAVVAVIVGLLASV
jgi:hypothetical protein